MNRRLNSVYGCVQGGHAVAQYMLENPGSTWKNEYLIYLWADIEKWMEKLDYLGIKYSAFHEPDMNGTVTAIAVQDDTGLMFQSLKVVE